MSYNFKRAYALTIGTAPSGYYIPRPVENSNSIDVPDDFNTIVPTEFAADFSAIPASAIEINTLQMEAKLSISKDDAGQPQQVAIKVYNLDQETIDFVSRTNSLVILKAGYETEDSLGIIFTGQVKSVHTRREREDVVTTINASDGFTPATGIKVTTSLIRRPPEAPLNYEDVFRYFIEIWKGNGVAISDVHIILDAVGLPMAKSPKQTEIPDGWSFEGYLRDAMDDLCEAFNYVWYIQNNVLFIHAKNDPVFTPVINLSEDQIKDLRPTTKSGSSSLDEEDTGFAISTFLNSQVKVGNRLRIVEGSFKGDYNIVGVSHSLNFRGSDWDTHIETEVIK